MGFGSDLCQDQPGSVVCVDAERALGARAGRRGGRRRHSEGFPAQPTRLVQGQPGFRGRFIDGAAGRRVSPRQETGEDRASANWLRFFRDLVRSERGVRDGAPAREPCAPVPLRAPAEQVMRLERMGASFPTRLSFMRQLVRRMYGGSAGGLERRRFDLDAEGRRRRGLCRPRHRNGPTRLVCIHATRSSRHSGRIRVIAEVWDATFSLFDGVPGDSADVERSARLARRGRRPAGSCSSELCAGARQTRACACSSTSPTALAAGRQPDAARLVGCGLL